MAAAIIIALLVATALLVVVAVPDAAAAFRTNDQDRVDDEQRYHQRRQVSDKNPLAFLKELAAKNEQVTQQANSTSSSSCGTPEFDGAWEAIDRYPLDVGEAQGGIIGTDLVITGGFLPGFTNVTTATYALDVVTPTNNNNPSATYWRRMDDFPMALGMTHAAFAIHDSKLYMCGGYLGSHPGQAVADCFVYDHSIPPGQQQQWSRMPSLPEPRAGGGLVYDTTHHVIVYAGGAVRPVIGDVMAVDYDTSWMLPVDNYPIGWVVQNKIPHLGNHLSFTTATDADGNERHYFMGGQVGENERNGNQAAVLEYNIIPDSWERRASMTEGRGHAGSSTIAYGCGFVIVGGAINGGYQKLKTDDISFYDIASDSWTSLGALWSDLKSPVCDVFEDYLYCSTGYTRHGYRRKLKSNSSVPI